MMLDRVDEPLDAPEEPYGNRFLHPPPLQIKPGSIPNMKRALWDCTNSIPPPADFISPHVSVNVYTPPTMKPNRYIRSTSISGSSRDSLRRECRYSLAEQALSDALKRCTSERSSRELQILALEQAMAALSTRANESRDHAAKLKISLADRTVHPDHYATLQSDRWMEERRRCVAEREFRQLSQHLASLKLKKEHTGSFDVNPSATPFDNEARRRANLVKFFERSPTRISFHLHHKCRPLFVDCTFSRRMTMSDVSPLRLRPSASPLRFSTKHVFPTSIHGTPAVPTRLSSKPRLASGPSSLFRTTRFSSASLTQSPTPSSRLLLCNDNSDDVTSTRPSTPPLSITSTSITSTSITSTSSNEASYVPRAPSQAPEAPSGGGVATIYASTSPRSHTEILAELDEDSVRVPEYAVNLLQGFDLIHHDLTLPERDISSKAMEDKPAAVVPRPSEESDTGPYSPFALPASESGPSWSHTSLNSPSTPRSHVPTLHPLSSGSSTPSGISTRTAPRASPSRPTSLLFLMRKRKEQSSPASSITHLDEKSAPGSKRRFSLFSRK